MSDAPSLIRALTDALEAAGDPEHAAGAAAYLKVDLRHLGVRVPEIRRLTKAALAQAGPLDHDALRAVLAGLWVPPVLELRMAAVEVAVARVKALTPADLVQVEAMLREARTWALVDPLASQVAEPLLARHPDADAVLDRWARDEDFWIRRSALLAHLLPLRAGRGNWPRFARLADQMLEEDEFFVRKAIGWILRDTARKRPELVFAWLLPRASRASGVTIREAVKHLGEDRAEQILRAWRR